MHHHQHHHRADGLRTLNEMERGQRGVVVEIHGGHLFVQRLADIGLRINKTVTKVCNQPMHGPVQVKVDNTEIAIGRHMSQRIFVKCLDQVTCDT